jgi:hypothetical protein
VRRPREDRARLICGCREITPAQREFSEHRPQSIVPSQLPANRPHIAPSSSQVDGTHWHKMFEGIAGTVRPGHAKQPPRGFSAVHALAHAPQSIVPPQRSEIGPHCLAASRQPARRRALPASARAATAARARVTAQGRRADLALFCQFRGRARSRLPQIFRSHGLHAVVTLWGQHGPRHRSYRGKRAISEQTATALGSLRVSSLLEPVTGLLQ